MLLLCHYSHSCFSLDPWGFAFVFCSDIFVMKALCYLLNYRFGLIDLLHSLDLLLDLSYLVVDVL
jgi:hypothetical protein